MLLGILVNGYSVVLAIISMVVFCRRYGEECLTFKNREIKSSIVYRAFTVLVLTIILTIQFRYVCEKDSTYVYSLIKWSTLFWGCYLLGWIDYKERIIPNKNILGLGITRIIFLVYELIVNFELWKRVLVYPVLGAFIGAMVIGVTLLIAGKGVGMGDVKLFLVIGAYVGSREILAVMTCSFLASAAVGVVLLILKKVKLKDSVPMAPFAFSGVAVQYILLMLGGVSV